MLAHDLARKFGLLFLVVGSMPWSFVHAQTTAPASNPEDKRFVVIQEKADFQVQSKVIGTAKEGTIIQVDAINGDWLWVSSAKAYLPKTAALPIRNAIQVYTDRIAKKPEANNYLQRGQLYRAIGDLDKSTQDVEAGLQASPGNIELLLMKGIVLLDRKEYESAIQAFNKCIGAIDAVKTPGVLSDVSLDGKTIMVNSKVLALNNRGWAHSEKGDFATAVSDFDRALLIDPNYLRASLNRALTLERQGQVDQAIEGYQEILKALPKHARTINNRGRAYFVKGDLQKAIADFDEAIKIDPLLTVAFANRRSVWQKQKDWKKIFDELESLATLPKPTIDSVNSLAWFLATCPEKSFRDGKRAKELAVKNCEAASYNNAGMLDTLAAASAELQEFDKAVEYQQKAIGLADAARKADYEIRLNLYKQKKPFRLE